MRHHIEKEKINKIIIVNLFLFFVSIYLLSASGFNLYNVDVSHLRLEVLKSITERFDFAIPAGIGIKGADGRDYSWFSIGSILFNLPFYVTGQLLGIPPEKVVCIINQLVGAATVVLVFIFCISLGYSKRASLTTSFFYGLGTMAWYYAKDPGDHAIETFFILLSVYFMYRHIIDRKVSLLLFSGLALGVAVTTRPTSIFIMPFLFILKTFYCHQSFPKASIKSLARDVILFLIPLLPFIAIILFYNYYRFNSIFESGYTLYASRLGIDSFFTGTPLLTGLSGLLISPGKGFFYYSPVAILFFFSIRAFSTKHAKILLCFVCIMISYLLFFSRYVYWHGDCEWGPRYLFVITPFLIIPTAAFFDSPTWKENKLVKVAVHSLLAISIAIQLASVSVSFYKYFFHLQIDEKVYFTSSHGAGVQTIYGPPSETYFDWHKSPILAQFKFIHEIATTISNYKYTNIPDNTNSPESYPFMHIYDFWWLYNYFVEGSFLGFFVAAYCLLLTFFGAFRLRKAIVQDYEL